MTNVLTNLIINRAILGTDLLVTTVHNVCPCSIIKHQIFPLCWFKIHKLYSGTSVDAKNIVHAIKKLICMLFVSRWSGWPTEVSRKSVNNFCFT